jgi:hypothetical protein
LGWALATAAAFGALSLPLSATAALGFLPTATLLFGLRLATMAATALIGLCCGGRGNRKCRHARYENEVPHLESPFVSSPNDASGAPFHLLVVMGDYRPFALACDFRGLQVRLRLQVSSQAGCGE